VSSVCLSVRPPAIFFCEITYRISMKFGFVVDRKIWLLGEFNFGQYLTNTIPTFYETRFILDHFFSKNFIL
jgi:hypothetical protein